jgi:penicillin-binding protein 1A
MRRLLKVCLIGITVVVLVPILALLWLFFDPRGLPDIESLLQFAPKVATQVFDPCLRIGVPIVAVPYDSIGSNLRGALSAAEASEDDPGLLRAYDLSFSANFREEKVPRTGLSYQIQKTMFCQPSPSRTVNHHLDSLRLAAQLERRYSSRDLFTIFANRTYFGAGRYGVEAASQYFFGKEPEQLLVQEAALLAGLPRSPTRFSPRLHPDRALERRNQVIDEMVAARAITESEGTAAKAAPLSIVAIGRQL